MATQLTTRSRFAALSARIEAFDVKPRYVVAGALICVVLVYVAMAAGIITGRRDERAAESRYADARQLLAVPPVPIATLTAELDAARWQLAVAQIGAQPGSIDAASDETTALLVRRAQDANLSVTGFARLDPSQVPVNGKTYDADSVRLTVRGATPQDIIAFLAALQASEPALIATLNTLNVDAGNAQAEVVFSAYREAVPDATPAASEAGR